MEFLVNAVTGKVRQVVKDGTEYLVVPMSILVPGVLNGSKGALYYPKSEVMKRQGIWNNVHILGYHPTKNGQPVSLIRNDGTHDPEILNTSSLGIIKNDQWTGKKRIVEGWFDVAKVKAFDQRQAAEGRAQIYNRLRDGQLVELSTGLYTDNENAPPGATWNGRPYAFVARNYRPDHLAILPDQVGACSTHDGCGAGVANAQDISAAVKAATEKLNKHPGRMPGYGKAYVRGTEVWYVGGDGDTREFGELVEPTFKSAGATSVRYEAESSPKEEGWKLVSNNSSDGDQQSSPAVESKPEKDPLKGDSYEQNYNPDQPRDDHGRFAASEASGQAKQASRQVALEHGSSEATKTADFKVSQLHQRMLNGGRNVTDKGSPGTPGKSMHSSLLGKAHEAAARAHRDEILTAKSPEAGAAHRKAAEAHDKAAVLHHALSGRLAMVGNEDVQNAWTDEAREASIAARKATRAVPDDGKKSIAEHGAEKIAAAHKAAGSAHMKAAEASEKAGDMAARKEHLMYAADHHDMARKLTRNEEEITNAKRCPECGGPLDEEGECEDCGYIANKESEPAVTNTETDMTKPQLIDYLVTNCECWKGPKDREVLNTFDEAKLKTMKTVVENAKKNEIVANAARSGINTKIGVIKYDDGKGVFVNNAGGSFQGEQGGGAKVAGTEDSDLGNEVQDSDMHGKGQGGTVGNPIPGGKAVKNESRLTAEEKEDLAYARNMKQAERKKLITRLVANVAQDHREKAAVVYNKHTLEDLRELVAALPPTRNAEDRRGPLGGLLEPAPIFGGGGTIDTTTNSSSDDLLEEPRMTFNSDRLKVGGDIAALNGVL